MSSKKGKPYRIIGAYDSETTNIYNGAGKARAFPILHQLGLLSCAVEDVTPGNVRDVCNIELYRHTVDLTTALDGIASTVYDHVPVICCHNMSFDMHPLANWLGSKDVRVLAKSTQKPITFTILDEAGNPRLVLWDTLVFSGQSLARMGMDCGYEKAVGSWDYDLIRTPKTWLTPQEIEYATDDIYALMVWIAWWLGRNPDIPACALGRNCVTKTGVVRMRRKQRFDGLKGQGLGQNVGRYWYYVNREELPKTDDELFTMHACTRGGFTFCAANNASKPFDLPKNECIVGYDATSMHPSHMVSHRYPVRFRPATCDELDTAARIVMNTGMKRLLDNFSTPFPVAFDACFRVDNIRLKKGSIYERDGIGTLASQRFAREEIPITDDNERAEIFRKHIESLGYKDIAINGTFAFGKLIKADSVYVYLTELELWILNQVYDFDNICAACGYLSGNYQRPTDMSVLSVMQFFDAKNVFKHARLEYLETGTVSCADDLRRVQLPDTIISEMEEGRMTRNDLDAQYLTLKADLNSLFGIECTTEHRQDTVLGESGIEYDGPLSVECAPKNPKAWYQFGQRIVGWSRVAQIVALELCKDYAITVVNGDTDSTKMHVKTCDIPKIDAMLGIYGAAIDKAKSIVCKRVKAAYPAQYSSLDGIGHYESEFKVQRYCAGWNKAYCVADDEGNVEFTLAGIPARRGLNDFAAGKAESEGFEAMASLVLGYNVTLDSSVTGLNGRRIPEWGSVYNEIVTDYKGDASRVAEPQAVAIYPLPKLINGTDSGENRANAEYAVVNNPAVNLDSVIVYRDKAGDFREQLL